MKLKLLGKLNLNWNTDKYKKLEEDDVQTSQNEKPNWVVCSIL